MMALRVRDLPVGNWLYELKFDGYRAACIQRLLRWTLRASRPSSSFNRMEFARESRSSTTPLICLAWKDPICVLGRLLNDVRCLPSCSRKPPKISATPRSYRAAEKSCCKLRPCFRRFSFLLGVIHSRGLDRKAGRSGVHLDRLRDLPDRDPDVTRPAQLGARDREK